MLVHGIYLKIYIEKIKIKEFFNSLGLLPVNLICSLVYIPTSMRALFLGNSTNVLTIHLPLYIENTLRN